MFDPKCLELAEHFLPVGTEQSIAPQLAQCIQDEIEAWLEANSKRFFPDMYL